MTVLKLQSFDNSRLGVLNSWADDVTNQINALQNQIAALQSQVQKLTK